MTIRVTYNTEDIATYISLSYENPAIDAVWGQITGTLSNQTDLQLALDAKVPYSGATANVNLGEFELKAGQMTLDITPTGTAAVGTTRWNDTIGSSETTLKGGSVILKNGVDLVARVVNKVSPNTTLTKAAYQAVRISGAQGQRLAVALAQANNDNNSADTIGLVTETIATNQEGFIMTVGSLESINTTGSLQGETWADGDVIYLSPTTAGALTNIKPIAPQHIIVIGYVEYAHANNGKLYVKVMNGWELGELHDVDTTGASAGQVLKYNGTIWTPSGDVGITSLNGLNATSQTFATGSSGTDFNISSATSTHTFNLPTASGTNRGLLSSADWTTFNSKQNALTNPITGTAAAGQVAYFTGATTQAGSNNLFWDATNNRLGIGTATPLQTLHSNGSAYILGSDATVALQVRPNAAVSSAFNTFEVLTTAGAQQFVINRNGPVTSAGQITIGGQNIYRAGDILFRTSAPADNGIIGQTTQETGSTTLGFTSSLSRKFTFSHGIYALGNTILGPQSADSGQRLQVTGDTLLKGSGNGSTTYALTVQSADGTQLARFQNGGVTEFNILNPNSISLNSNGSISSPTSIFMQVGQGGTDARLTIRRAGNLTTQTGNVDWLAINTSIDTTRSFAPTSGTATMSMIRADIIVNQTGGANGITRGLYVNPTLTAAADWRSIEWSNNTGWGLYGAGTAPNLLNGNLGIGSTSLTATNLYIGKNITGANISNGVAVINNVNSDVISRARIFFSEVGTVAAAFNLLELNHFYAVQGTFGAGSSVTNQFGFRAHSTLTGATNNYGFYGDIPSGTGRWNLYMNGTANNYMAGALGIGTTSPSRGLRIGLNPTAADSSMSSVNVAVQNTVTTQYRSYLSSVGLNASGFTLPNLSHFEAIQDGAFTSGVVTNHYGFRVNALSDGTNVFGFHSSIAAATGRWNFYAQGTALNYFNGNTLIGSTSDTGEKLQVTGTAKITGGLTTNLVTSTLNANTYISLTGGGGAFIDYRVNNADSVRFSSTGLFIGSATTPTAILDISASVTARASLRIRSGTAPTTPNDGDIWFDGTDLKMRIGGVTKTFTLI
jgi:hypothetical protein